VYAEREGKETLKAQKIISKATRRIQRRQDKVNLLAQVAEAM